MTAGLCFSPNRRSMSADGGHRPPLQRALDDSALFVIDPVQLVNQIIDVGVGGGDFAVDAVNLRGRELAGMLLLVQFQRPVNEFHHLVVPGFVGRVGEVDGADGESFKILAKESEVNFVCGGNLIMSELFEENG
jgi:hypothetical protein